jgi:hypothetical protein
VVFVVIALATGAAALRMRRLIQRVRQLERQLPVCRACGVIRREDGEWVQLATLPSPRSHCMCPACEEKHYGSVN